MPKYPPVVIEREYNAPIERVFRAWTDPGQLRQWFKEAPETEIEPAKFDLRAGGDYRIEIKSGDEDYVVYGTYTKVDPPRTLEFTWMWEESSMEPGETLVRVDLEPIGDRTKLTLTHTRFTTERSAQAHDKGWNGVLASLEKHLA